MKLEFKQTEIQTALTEYAARQGINIVGKEVKIAFSAGRKESGLTAVMSIEDSVPTVVYVGDIVAGVATTPLNVVPVAVVQAVQEDVKVTVETAVAEPAVETETVVDAPVTPTKSLFG